MSTVERAIRSCELCSLGRSALNLAGGGPFSGWWRRERKGPLVFVVGMNPNKNRRPEKTTVGWNWLRWAETLEAVVRPEVSIYFTNLLKCSTPDNQLTKSWYEVNKCAFWLPFELRAANQDAEATPTVLLLGRQVGQWFDVEKYKLLELPLAHYRSVTAFQVPHPAYSVRFGTYRYDLEMARRHLCTVKPETFYTNSVFSVERK